MKLRREARANMQAAMAELREITWVCQCGALNLKGSGVCDLCQRPGEGENVAPTPEAAAREAVWAYLRDLPDCSITWTESAYIAQLAVEAWKAAEGRG